MFPSASCLLLRFRRQFFLSAVLIVMGIACGSWTCAEAKVASPAMCGLSSEVAAEMSGDPVTDVHAISEYKKAISGLLTAQKFQELDCLADAERKSKETFPGGMWKVHTI